MSGRVTTLTPQVCPSRRRPLAQACGFACRFQIGEQRANPFPAHARTGLFDVNETELAGLLTDRRKYQPGLCAARGFHLPSAPLKFAIGATDDGEKMIEPWKEVVLALMPALRTFLKNEIVVFFRLFDKPLQADVPAHFIAVLIER